MKRKNEWKPCKECGEEDNALIKGLCRRCAKRVWAVKNKKCTS